MNQIKGVDTNLIPGSETLNLEVIVIEPIGTQEAIDIKCDWIITNTIINCKPRFLPATQ